jgi:hypothetical protein
MPDLDELLAPFADRETAEARTPDAPAIARAAQRRTQQRRVRTGVLVAIAMLVAVGLPLSRRAASTVDVAGAGDPTGSLGGSVPPGSATSPPTVTTLVPSTTATTESPTTSTTSPGASGATTTTGPFTPPLEPVDPRLITDLAPWGVAPLDAADYPVNVAAWRADTHPNECPLLVPDDLGAAVGAIARVEAIPQGLLGSWWVYYDLPGAPGSAHAGDLATANGGQGTIAIGANGGGSNYTIFGLQNLSAVDHWAKRIHYADGSGIGYGPEGFGKLKLPTGVPTAYLAYVQLGGSACGYNVVSYLGEDNLVHLLQHLRRVDGAP